MVRQLSHLNEVSIYSFRILLFKNIDQDKLLPDNLNATPISKSPKEENIKSENKDKGIDKSKLIEKEKVETGQVRKTKVY